MENTDTMPLASVEETDNLETGDYVIVAKADDSIRKLSALHLKDYMESDILGGAS